MSGGKRKWSGPDLFDEDTLLSVLSNTLEDHQNSVEHAPTDGDCMLFEGMQFFFVEDYQTPKSSSEWEQDQSRASRRLSIEVDGGNGSRRRLSLVGACCNAIATANNDTLGIPQNSFPLWSQQPETWRAHRRFSLQREAASGGSKHVLVEIV